MADLSDAYALPLLHPKAQEIRDELELFQAVCAAIAGSIGNSRQVT